MGAEEQTFLRVNYEREGSEMVGRNESRWAAQTSRSAIFDPFTTIPEGPWDLHARQHSFYFELELERLFEMRGERWINSLILSQS